MEMIRKPRRQLMSRNMTSSGHTQRNLIDQGVWQLSRHIQRYDSPHLNVLLSYKNILCKLTNKPYTQVTKLCGPEPLTKYVVLLVVSIQVLCAYLLRDTPFFSWKFFLTAYIIGATATQNLFLAIHEISHNLAFRNANANRALAVFANL